MHNNAPETRPEHIYNTSSYILYLSAKEIAYMSSILTETVPKKHPEGSMGGKRWNIKNNIYIIYGETHPFSVVNNVWM